jgi:hypothetical protein
MIFGGKKSSRVTTSRFMHYTTMVVSSAEIAPGPAGYHHTAHHATRGTLKLYNQWGTKNL